MQRSKENFSSSFKNDCYPESLISTVCPDCGWGRGDWSTLKTNPRGFPCTPVVKSPPCNPGDTCSMPGGVGSHTPQGNLACASELLSRHSRDHALQQEKPLQWVQAPRRESNLCCLQLEKACVQQPRPSAAKNKWMKVSPSHLVVSPRNTSGCFSAEDTLDHYDLIAEDRLNSNASPVSNTQSICRFLQVSDQPQVSMPITGMRESHMHARAYSDLACPLPWRCG